MERIENFRQMSDFLARNKQRRRIAVVCGSDASTLAAIKLILEKDLADVLFVGSGAAVKASGLLSAFPASCSVTDAADAPDSARKAVELIRRGEADVLMKGLIGTDVLLRAVLDKEHGLLPSRHVLTHMAVAQLPAYGKLLFFSDAAVIPYPTHEQRCAQVGYAARVLRAFGIAEPCISLIHCTEKPSEKFPHTMGYAEIKERASQGDWGHILIDGPLDVRTSCDPQACAAKSIDSSVGGRADVLIFPDIEAANAFYKTLSFLAGGKVAGMLCGASCPVVLPSRGDDAEAKFNSLMLALMTVEGGKVSKE